MAACLPAYKTRIVCTIGPASQKPAVMKKLLLAGMTVARLNLVHGNLPSHAATIKALRQAALDTGRRLAILTDLPGPKLRIGQLKSEPLWLYQGQEVLLGPDTASEHPLHIPLKAPELVTASRPGQILFLNDGFIQIRILSANDHGIRGRVIVGGPLRSHKGINAPAVTLGAAFTENDHHLLSFALGEGVDAVGISFVQSARDIVAVRTEAESLGQTPFLVAKIERRQAVENIREILNVADGIMIARGDLGVETPIEGIALLQKRLINLANRAGKPVITATQMLESMTRNSRPTRAEATDVANAIIDGTDAVMLSEESAAGKYPVESVRMLTRIAKLAERHPHLPAVDDVNTIEAVIAADAAHAAKRLHAHLILTLTRTGATARRVARLRVRPWVVALSRHPTTCQHLQFSRGIHPIQVPPEADWDLFIPRWLRENAADRGLVIITRGPSVGHPKEHNRLEVVQLAHHTG